jgi:hypothetical protein
LIANYFCQSVSNPETDFASRLPEAVSRALTPFSLYSSDLLYARTFVARRAL